MKRGNKSKHIAGRISHQRIWTSLWNNELHFTKFGITDKLLDNQFAQGALFAELIKTYRMGRSRQNRLLR
jgi:hypothetical protein